MNKERWTHNICMECWNEREPGRTPLQVQNIPPDTCCYCGLANSDGIYIRDSPQTAPCTGRHPEPTP